MTDFQVGFPCGQFMAAGVDPETARKLSDVFYEGTDSQPIINRIADPQIRAKVQRITNNLANHSARGKGR